jgi:hypothetical protein
MSVFERLVGPGVASCLAILAAGALDAAEPGANAPGSDAARRSSVGTPAAGPVDRTPERHAPAGERRGRWELVPVGDWVITESRRPAVTVSASSFLSPWQGYTFYPQNVLDGKLGTSWQPQKTANGGVGQWVKLSISPPTTITGVRLGNGFQSMSKFGDLYWMNNRIKSATLSFSDGSSVTIRVPDQPEIQTFWLDPPKVCSWVNLHVNAVYRGSKWNDLAISEFNVIFPDREGL